jgi:transposase
VTGSQAVIQASKSERRIMRHELTDHQWVAIKPMLPNKPRGIPRVNDRRVLNGIFGVLRSGAPWRDLPHEFGPYTTCYSFAACASSHHWSRELQALGDTVRLMPPAYVRPYIKRYRNEKCEPTQEPLGLPGLSGSD